MKNVLFSFSIGLLALVGYHDYGGFDAPEQVELASVWGGQDAAAEECQDCEVILGSCLGDACDGFAIFGFRYWVKKTGSLTNKMQCFTVEETAPGAKECFTDTPKVCYTTQVCTDAACTNCGAATETKVDTNCSVGGDYCPPKADAGGIEPTAM